MPPLFAKLPDVFATRFAPAAPWDLLGEFLDEILAALPSSDIRRAWHRTSTSRATAS